MLNDKNHRMQRMDVWKVFTRHFPTYSRLVQEIKKYDHTAMASFLQQLESEIMFGDVISRFRELTLDRSPFFTCHDSIYTLKQSRNLLATLLTLKDSLQQMWLETYFWYAEFINVYQTKVTLQMFTP